MGSNGGGELLFLSSVRGGFGFPLLGKRREAHQEWVSCFFLSSVRGGFDSPYRGNEGERIRSGGAGFFSFPSVAVSISPTGETKGDGIRSQAEKLFFLQKVFLFAISHREIANSLFKNAPYGKGVPLSAESGQGLLAPGPSAECLRRRFAFTASANNSLIPRAGSLVLHLVRFATAWVAH